MVDREMEEIFLREATRRLAEVDQILQRRFPVADSPGLIDLQRHAHSLKGIAGSVGLVEVETCARDIWTQLDDEKNGRAPPLAVEGAVRVNFERIRAEIERIAGAHGAHLG